MDDNSHHEEALIRVWVTRWILKPVARPPPVPETRQGRAEPPTGSTGWPDRRLRNDYSAPWTASIYVVGGTAAALWAGDRTSHDADHHMPDLEHRFSEVLDRLEALPGWITARIRRPHLILGHLDGVVAGMAQYSTVASGSMQVETAQVNAPLLKNRLLMTRNMPGTTATTLIWP